MEAHNQCVTNIAEESINHQIFQYEKQFSIFYKKKKLDLEKRSFEVIMKERRVGIFTLVNERLRFVNVSSLDCHCNGKRQSTSTFSSVHVQ